jgi:hypothetical protein
MKQRARVEHLGVHRGWLCVDAAKVDGDFPRCPICSPASALQHASCVIERLILRAAVRNGATRRQARELVAFATGGHGTLLTDDLQKLDLRAPGQKGRRQRIPTERIVAGLNRLIWRALFCIPAQGYTGRTPVGRIYAIAPTMARVRDRALRSCQGQRDARAAIRWLLAGSKPKLEDVSVAEFVRRLYRPCGIHEVEFDLHWCGWNSERGRLRAGVPVRRNNPRRHPTPAARPIAGPWSAATTEDSEDE